MSFKITYTRKLDEVPTERTFDEYATAKAFFNEKKKVHPIVVFTETRLVEAYVAHDR